MSGSKPRIQSLLAATAFLAGGLFSGVSLAEDGKVYPAVTCQPALDGTPSQLDYQGNKIVNKSTANSVVVTCPIIKDDVFATAGLQRAYVRFRKASQTGFLGDIHSYSVYGTGHHVQYKSDFSSAGYKTMSFSPIPGFSQGYYMLMLVLPPKAEVFSYRVDEL